MVYLLKMVIFHSYVNVYERVASNFMGFLVTKSHHPIFFDRIQPLRGLKSYGFSFGLMEWRQLSAMHPCPYYNHI